jgi:hypothetical protein
MDRSYPDF